MAISIRGLAGLDLEVAAAFGAIYRLSAGLSTTFALPTLTWMSIPSFATSIHPATWKIYLPVPYLHLTRHPHPIESGDRVRFVL
mmetsp:Transcript_9133/g.15976  ORF Transcript_9133/g.15976 Transcript_9133/m.15976 type:complete len:84 (+) Transcript_9133:738-989(+)